MAVICSSKNTEIFHRYKGIGGIKRYVSRMKLTHKWQVQPYMVALYRNHDTSGELVITFMNERLAECSFPDYIAMIALVRRWRNLRRCSISESYSIDVDDQVYQLEHIWAEAK